MGLLLPLGFFVLLFALTASWAPHGRVPLIEASVYFSALLFVMTELLSASRALTPMALNLAWAAGCVVAMVALVLSAARCRACFGGLSSDWSSIQPTSAERLVAVGLGLLSVLVLGSGLLAPPNTWDAMTYHLPRVHHWLANGSLDFYPSHIPRQLMLAPFASYAVLHAVALGGGTWAAFGLQFLCWLLTAFTAARLTRMLGVAREGQWLAAVFAATVPMAVLQASGTQVDCAAAFFELASVYMVVQALRAERLGASMVLCLAVAAGLAVLTKATAWFFAAPFWALACGATIGANPRRSVALAAALALGVLGLNGLHGLRNSEVFGSPFAAPSVVRATRVTPPDVLSGVLRNLALHASTPEPAVNEWMTGLLRKAIESTGVSPDAPETTLPYTQFRVPALSRSEDDAGAPLHALFALAAFVLLHWRGRRSSDSVVLGLLAASCVIGLLLFSALLKWQPYHARLHLPLWGLAAPLVAWSFHRFALGRRVASALCFALLLSAAPMALAHATRPWIGEGSVWTTESKVLQFAANPQGRVAFEWLAQELNLRACDNLGLHVAGDGWEEPLWTLRRRPGARVQHVNVRNPSKALAAEAPTPCAIAFVDSVNPAHPGPTTPNIELNGVRFGRVGERPSVALYVPY